MQFIQCQWCNLDLWQEMHHPPSLLLTTLHTTDMITTQTMNTSSTSVEIKVIKFIQLVQHVMLKCISSRNNTANNSVQVIALVIHSLMIKEGKSGGEVRNVMKYAPTSQPGFPNRLITIFLIPTTATTPVLKLTNRIEIARLAKMNSLSLLVKLMASSAAFIKISSVMVTQGVTTQRMRISTCQIVLRN